MEGSLSSIVNLELAIEELIAAYNKLAASNRVLQAQVQELEHNLANHNLENVNE